MLTVGYGSLDVEGSCNHYIHHAKFDYNYGSSPFWDHVCGTNYTKASATANDARSKRAAEQARLVGCKVGDGVDAT
jgi:sterol desaturase/sphingolipid hydroxylase (fatty acid hydroxylase superfamily)